MLMQLPEGQYNVIQPPSWGDLTNAIRTAPVDGTKGPLLKGVEFGPTAEDELARRRKAMGESAYIGATMDLTVMSQHFHPDSRYVLAENESVLVRFEPTNRDDPTKPAGAYVVPLDPENSPEVWRGSVPTQQK